MCKIKIGSVNARGLADPVKRRDVFMWLKEKGLDIICLQDVHFRGDWCKKYEDEWGGQCVLNAHTTESRGVAILVRKNLEFKIEDINKDEEGNYLQATLKVNGLDFVLATVYGPNRDKPKFYHKIMENLIQKCEYPIILCGDWNLVLDQERDTRGYLRENNRKARQAVLDMVENMDLLDIWRSIHPDKRQYTWKNAKKAAQRGRLDFFLVSKDVGAMVKDCKIHECYRSDHKLISLEIDKLEWKKGRGFWKLDTSCLVEKEYLGIIREAISETISRYRVECEDEHIDKFSINPQMLFEMIKLEVRGRTIEYTSRKRKRDKQKESVLLKEIRDLDGEIDKTDDNKTLQEEIGKKIAGKQKELEELRIPKVKLAMKRCKAQYYEEGEKPSKFFFELEKKNYISKLITRLEVDGDIIENPSEILDKQRSYYKDLYSSKMKQNKGNELEYFLDDSWIKKITEEQKQKCEGLITEQEVKVVIRNMKNNKTPGTDGIPAEFYKIFWKQIGPFMVKSLNYSFKAGQLSITQKQGIIICIPKTENRNTLNNWRPITLLNVDYKVLSGVLSYRMREILKDIIGQQQKGFLRGRYIGESTRLVYDIMHFLERKHQKGLIMLIDFQKAFDSLEWNYIERILSTYGFGNDFLAWHKILYNQAQSCVINGGHFSTFFNIERGCRQGDPLSPYIFILAAEPLAMAIKHSKKIKGIKVKGKEYKLGQYADDTYTLMDGSEESLAETLEILDKFQVASGLKTNVDKTKLIWLGSAKNSLQTLCPHVKLKWTNSFKLLGIKFHVNLKDMIDLNYNIKIGEIENMLGAYQKRRLSLLGKVTVIKTLVIPKLLHIMSVLPSPGGSYIQKLETRFSKFVWNNKRGRISYSNLCKPVDKGGLNLTKISPLIDGLRITWIKRLLRGEGDWQELFKETITDDYGLIWELDTDSLVSFRDQITNEFWYEVFDSWNRYRVGLPTDQYEYLYYPVWNSSIISTKNIRKDKKAFKMQGLNYVINLFKENGDLLGFEEFKDKFKVNINFIDFYSLSHSIRFEWRNIPYNYISRDKGIIAEHIELIVNKDKLCRYVYTKLLDHTITTNVNEAKWNTILGDNLDSDMWTAFYKSTFSATVENKLRSFQYQILKRSLVTNKFLNICKIRDDDRCYYCDNSSETIEHLLYDCERVQNFWISLCNIIQEVFNIRPYIVRRNVLLGSHNTGYDSLLNFIFVTCKRYIYVTRCLKRKLDVIAYMRILKDYYNIERYLSNLKGTTRLWKKKWAPICSILDV